MNTKTTTTTTKKRRPGRPPKTPLTGCRHNFNVDNHNVGTCSLCGEVRQFPFEKGGEVVVLKAGRPPAKRGQPKIPSPQHSAERHAYYESHKDEIIRDLLRFGRTPTRKKWGIRSSSSLFTLERRWLTSDQRATLDSLTSSSAPADQSPGTSGNGHLPHFPEFSNTWKPEVQLVWLEVYGDLHARAETATP